MKLSNLTLENLPKNVVKPHYDRGQLSPGILHIGLGNFHRAHQSWYTHQLMQRGLALDWAIIGGGVRSVDRLQRERLLTQDCLTTLIELDPNGKSAEIVGSMIDYVPVEKDCISLVRKMSEPSIRIVSLTVTEGGYYLHPVTGELDDTHPEIIHDINNPDTPCTVFGAMISALKIRHQNDSGPFTCLSCDNLQSNGDVLRKVLVSLAKKTDPEIGVWIDKNCSFPNSMVDCIVPVTGADELALVREFGIDDTVPVAHENYRQWVIEDDFCAGRPEWDLVGVIMCANVHDYEILKIRMLNAGHQIIANPGEILGLRTISDCMEHGLIKDYFRRIEIEEISPHVNSVPGMTPMAYVDLIDKRFSNPEIFDTTRRVAFDGSSRHPTFVLPIVKDGLSKGTSVNGLALAEAIWARMCEGTREDGSVVEPNDPNWDNLTKIAENAQKDPKVWLQQNHFYGELANSPVFADAFVYWLSMIWTIGIEQTLKYFLSTKQ